MSNITEMILRRYGIAGSIVSEEELSGGNVNLTFRVTVKDGASVVDYLVQKINPNALTKPRAAMRNMVLVTDHLRKKGIRTAALLPVGRSGERFLEIPRGRNAGYWRVEEYLNAVTLSQEDTNVLYEMARAFGRFNAAEKFRAYRSGEGRAAKTQGPRGAGLGDFKAVRSRGVSRPGHAQ